MEELKKLYKKHKTWVDIVRSFGCNKDTAEDIVMEMYIKIQKNIKDGLDIRYGDDDINYYYIFRTLSGMFIDLKRKESRTTFVDIENVIERGSESTYIDYDKHYSKIKEALSELYWYDKQVYELIESGEKISELSKKTKIGYYSLYFTYQKVVKYLKQKI